MMIFKDKVKGIIETISNDTQNVPLPKIKEELDDLWVTSFTKALKTWNYENIPAEEIEKIRNSTYTPMIQANLRAVEEEYNKKVTEYTEAFKQSYNEFNDIQSLSIFIDTYLQNAHDFFSWDLYIYHPEDALSDSSKFTNKLIENLKSIFAESQNDILIDFNSIYTKAFIIDQEILIYDILTYLSQGYDEQLQSIKKTISLIQYKITELLNEKITYFPILLKKYEFKNLEDKIMELWIDEYRKSFRIQEQEFVVFVEEVIDKIIRNEIRVFDGIYCSEECKNALFIIILATVPEKFISPRPLIELFYGLLVNFELTFDNIELRSKEHINQGIDSFLRVSNMQCRHFCIVSLIMVFSGLYVTAETGTYALEYLSFSRAWLKNIIFSLFFKGNIENPFYKNLQWNFVLIAEQILMEKIAHIENTLMYQGDRLEDPNQEKSLIRKTFIELKSAFNYYFTNEIQRFEFQRINEKRSLSLTLVVSGWLSQEDNEKIGWKDLNFRNYQGEVLALKWDSSSVIKLVRSSIEKASILIGIASCLSLNNMLAAGLIMKNPFNVSSEKAQRTGKILAEVLSSEEYYSKKPIALIGFSLGCKVIFSCLEELAKGNTKVSDVILMGGAAENDPKRWEVARKAVAGRLVNIYSKNDWTLSILYYMATFKKAVGNEKIMVSDIENYDVSDFIDGHMEYRKYLSPILDRIGYSNR
ncbi:hypothetical protein SteCoe_14469 [Stentor coeruleus]|uniref:DUF726 domain-containing protein n=1 Tax=Stentor coeruleus TaxID=5963 RepID=A0A1R2C5X8_9CILI|nr:hypothetical protein SteCoe_14469 [Stentor coeruleus]